MKANNPLQGAWKDKDDNVSKKINLTVVFRILKKTGPEFERQNNKDWDSDDSERIREKDKDKTMGKKMKT
jgi:hypothetical protein